MVWYSNHCRTAAGVVELVDTGDLKSPGSDTVPVRVRSPAPSSYRGVEQLVARRAHNPEVAGSSPVSATRQRTLKPQRFQGSFYAIWAGVFPLFFPLQIFKGNFQGVQPPQRCAAQAARMSGKPTPQTDFQHLGKGGKSASACRFSQHQGNPKFSLPFSPELGNVRGAPG